FLQLEDVLARVRQKVGKVEADLFGIDPLELVDDHLQGALEELHLALNQQELADLERSEDGIAGIPHAGVDDARAVGEGHWQVEIAVAIGPQLLVVDEENLLDRIAVGQLIHVAPGHVVFRRRWFVEKGAPSQEPLYNDPQILATDHGPWTRNCWHLISAPKAA